MSALFVISAYDASEFRELTIVMGIVAVTVAAAVAFAVRDFVRHLRGR